MAMVAYGGMLKAGARSDPEEELVRAVDMTLEVDAIIFLEMGEMVVVWQQSIGAAS
jgi:hypothetical protein